MKKILAIRNDRFGEFILNIPALNALKALSPRTKLHVIVAPSVRDLAGAVACIDKVFVRPAGPMPWWEDLALAGQLRAEKYDAAVVLNPSRESHHLVFLAGIPVRAGYRRKHHFLLTKTLEDKKNLGLRHEVDNNLDLVMLLGASVGDKSIALNLPAGMEEAVASKFGLKPGERMIAVHPWTSDPVKQWPLERFRALIDALGAQKGLKVVILGRPEAWHQELDSPSPLWGGVGEGGVSSILDLSQKTTLLEAAAVLKYCCCLVSCDSGPVHLAAAVGTPVVALFRNDMPGKNPERWGPWGNGHTVVRRKFIGDILVQDVVEALMLTMKRLP